MSYIYLQEREAGFLEECCSDIPQFALWKLNPIAEKSCCNGSETESCHDSQFGTTCEPSTASHGEAELMSSAADFHAKTLAAQEKAQALEGPGADCGEKWRVSFTKWDRVTCSWKIAHCLPLAGLDEFLETWPKWGMMQNGECFHPECLERIIPENVSSFLPTPVASESKDGMSKAGRLAELYKGDRVARCLGKSWTERSLMDYNTRICPNPSWQEWRMMWPIGWTELKPLGMDKMQEWFVLHGKR